MSNYFDILFEGKITRVCRDRVKIRNFFYEIAFLRAMSDCTDEHVVKIVYNNKEWRYTGWQPDMVYEFVADDGESVTICCPEYEH